RSEFHKDYDRIIFSSAFRRLSDKTQVVPLPDSDYTRRRLTHSLEVSCVGRSLATEVFCAAGEVLPASISQGEVEAIVASACLAHDIGNPPFGHFGERAIQDWAANWFGEQGGAELTPAEREDLSRFEGNAQSFRVLTRLQMKNRDGGMRLTAATLGALIKYPRPSLVEPPSLYKKHGCFQDDRDLFRQVFGACGRLPNAAGEYARHPLAWLAEAADDICYAVVDLEDGCKAGLVDLQSATRILDEIGQPRRRESHLPIEDRLAMGRALAINQLVMQASEIYLNHLDEILAGQFQGALIGHCPAAELVEEAKRVAFERVYCSQRVLELEAAGYRAIHGLLDMIVPAVLAERRSAFHQHLLRLTGLRLTGEMSTYQKILLCTDYVSGMTDRFCVEHFRRLSGHGIS
ncbi:MAG: dNTP triphosphohydrolase, partial [Planctomycetaceae bacterium]|nr:dNTP triphosphohydrolase [Planctomycetaceae bacterium]